MASTYMDLSAANYALKELYDGQEVPNEVYKDNPLFALVKKETNFTGEYHPLPLQYAVSQGGSATFSVAQGGQTPNQGVKFLITRRRNYDIVTIDNETMLASGSDVGSFVRQASAVLDGGRANSVLNLSGFMFRDGTGTRGAIATGGITSGVITLADLGSVTQFEVGMSLQANATSGGTPRAALGYVIAVDRDAGTVTVATSQGGSAASPSGWTAGDSLLRYGDNNATISGLAAWLPTTAPSSSDNFYGVNRSADVTRLAGCRYNGAAQDIPEAIQGCLQRLGREGGNPNYFVTNFASYTALQYSLGSRVVYEDFSVGEVGFSSIVVNGPKGKVRVVPDRSCPALLGYALTMSTWTFKSLGPAPQLLRYGDGSEFLRVSNADAGEARWGTYANLECNAPAWNAVATLSA